MGIGGLSRGQIYNGNSRAQCVWEWMDREASCPARWINVRYGGRLEKHWHCVAHTTNRRETFWAEVDTR